MAEHDAQRVLETHGLRLVREELLRSDESTDVTSVALRHGFTHLSGFSGYYHAAFGGLPRVTLRRRRAMTPD
jgi:transcriptional regulator GlxA family with amidase domain